MFIGSQIVILGQILYQLLLHPVLPVIASSIVVIRKFPFNSNGMVCHVLWWLSMKKGQTIWDLPVVTCCRPIRDCIDISCSFLRSNHLVYSIWMLLFVTCFLIVYSHITYHIELQYGFWLLLTHSFILYKSSNETLDSANI